MKPVDYSKFHFLLLFGIFAWLTYSMFSPYIDAAVFGFVFYSLFNPLMKFVEGRRYTKNKRITKSMAATILCVLILTSVLIPVTWIVYEMTVEATVFFSQIRKFLESEEMKIWFQNPQFNLIPDSILDYIPNFVLDFFTWIFSGFGFFSIDLASIRDFALNLINKLGGEIGRAHV